MSARTLVFCHANGFPAGTYRVLADAWRAAGWRVVAPETLGHDPRFPVTDNWPRLRDELAAFIEAHRHGDEPVHLVGHSLGGFLAMLVACRRPDLAAAVVMLDSPVVAGWRAHSLRAMRAGGLMRRISPGRISERRRHRWPSVDAAHAHFAAKAAFARWDPRVLRDYVDSGTRPAPDGDGVVLAFDRDVETRIYDTLPDRMGAVLQRHPPKCPVWFIAGTQSVEVHRVGLAATRALVRERLLWIDGSHLFPMEKPVQTAGAVLRMLG